MEKRKIVNAYVVESFSLILFQMVIILFVPAKMNILDELYDYVELVMDFLLMIYLIKKSKVFLISNLKKIGGSIRKIIKNTYILITMYIITFLATTLAGTLISSADIINYNQTGLEEIVQQDLFWSSIRIIVIAPITEELVFRGAIYGALRKKSVLLATIVTAFLFGMVHVWLSICFCGIQQIIVIIPYVLMGLGVSITYERTNNFIYAILFHMIHNGLTFAMMQV